MAKKAPKPINAASPAEEQVEGLGDEAEDDGLGDNPIDTLLIRKETRTVYDVVRRIENGGFIIDQYKKDMDDFLAKSLEMMNKKSPEELGQLSLRFRLGLQNNYDLFGRHAFRKHMPDQPDRNVINASLWDVMTTGLARFPESLVADRADTFRECFYNLLQNNEFSGTITYSPNSTKNVKKRFELADGIFKEVFGDYTD